ncbi:alpha/beta hydrolase [Kineococcus sp. NBC_00420]|uniref:alpha/beta fold hydrolase n=1 Tax=Kineococcus sp. NBC_00420 TaxID=2903564 RepID=UPI002E23DA03
MDTLTTDRIAGLAVRRTGTGEPVLALHGSGGGLHTFAPLARALPDFEVWRCARRGYPPSPDARGTRTFVQEVHDVHDLLATIRAVTESDVHLVGVGYGASLALHTALAEPAGIRSLTVIEPPLLLVGPHLQGVLTRYRGLVADRDFRAAADLFAREVTLTPEPVLAALSTLADPDPVAAAREAVGWTHDLEALAADEVDTTRWSVLADLDLPILLAQGERSRPPLPAGMDALAAALPHARRVVWEDRSSVTGGVAGAPELVAASLREFFRVLPQSS